MVETSRCLQVWEVGEAIHYVAWNPLPGLHILVVSTRQDVLLLNTGLGNDEEQKNIEQLLRIETPGSMDDTGQCNIAVISIVLYKMNVI